MKMKMEKKGGIARAGIENITNLTDIRVPNATKLGGRLEII